MHLPIGVLLFVAVLEIWKRIRKTNEFDAAIRAGLLFVFLAGIAAATTGWWLSEEGGYDAKMLWQHKWSGISLTVLVGVLFLSNQSKSPFLQKIYTPIFAGVLGLLTFVGHLGGNLTHGEDYLFSKPEDTSIVVADIEKAPIFSTFIEPIFKAKCNSCHNPAKAKGELVMTSREALLAGGKNGSIFNFEKPEASELLTRIHLPLKEKKHMPPKGKKQISDDEAALLMWWIENEACFECTVDSSKNRDSVASILEKYKSVKTNVNALKVDSISDKTLANLVANGISATRLSAKNPLVIVNLAGRQDLDKSVFKKLKKIGENILELNLSGSNFSDKEAHFLSGFVHLKKLQLQNTAISDVVIRSLRELKYLESLNLYGTAISDAATADLKAISTLKNLFFWQTKMSKSAIADLQNAKPTLQISSGIDESIFGDAKLNSPVIFAESEIFRDSMAVFLKSDFKNASIFYTLDGSDPDSNALIFLDTFYLKKSAKIRAISNEEGWERSAIAKRDFIKSKIQFASAKFAAAPNQSYKAAGAKSLFDYKKGSENFADGNWLGWQGENLTATLKLEEKQPLSKVMISSLSIPNTWIFYPKGIQIFTSSDGKNFELKKEETYAQTEQGELPDMKFFDVTFEETETKFLKVKVLSTLKNPDWHAAPGEPCWLFVDEILAE